MFDLLFRQGLVFDGTTDAPRIADVGVTGDQITAVGDLSQAAAAQVIDLAGKAIAPGFIDVHNHSEGWLLSHANFWPKTSQGFTTEVLMADGISYAPVDRHNWREWIHYLRSLNGLRYEQYQGWHSIADYLSLLDRRVAQNVIAHVPYANCRALGMGWGRQRPDDFQMRQIRNEIALGMEQGCVGLSTGLDYVSECFASTDELVEACKVIAPYRGLYVTHVRYKLGLLPAFREAVEIGRRSGARVHISHLKATSTQDVDEVLRFCDWASQEVDFSFDVYPYQRGSTMLNYLLPYEVWDDGPLAVLSKVGKSEILERFRLALAQSGVPLDRYTIAWTNTWDNSSHHGKLLSDYIAETGRSPEEALYHLLLEENLATLLVIDSGDDTLIEPILQHPAFMLGSDGIFFPDSVVHPRVYGSTGRMLGSCVRDKKLFTLAEAVHKMTLAPARRFGLAGRGKIAEGAFADLVVFDPETVGDRATYLQPHQVCAGIEQVLVNGMLIVENGQPVQFVGSELPGRVLNYQPV